jgi:hypothetical protein
MDGGKIYQYDKQLTPEETKQKQDIVDKIVELKPEAQSKTGELKRAAEEDIRTTSLREYIFSNNWKDAEELRNSIRKGDKLYLSLDQANALLELKKDVPTKGYKKKNYKGEFPLVDSFVRNHLVSWVPITIENVSPFAKLDPFKQKIVDYLHGFTELSVSSVNDLAETVAGPVGLIVVPFTGIAALGGIAVAVITDDLGQAVVHVVNWIPGAGASIAKFLTKIEHLNKKKEGGKRFKTLRLSLYKWKKNQRRKSRRH